MSAIVLVGLMGAGKSTVGRIVAERLDRPLIDSDLAIAASTGSSVRELWEEGGETAYRRLESDVVLDALRADPPSVIAAPGGTVLDPVVRTALRDAFVVWLRGDPSTLAARVSVGDHRPLLGSDPASALTGMAHDRAGLYLEVADAVLDIDDTEPGDLADQVIDRYHHASDAAPSGGE